MQAKVYPESLQKKESLGATSFAPLELTCTMGSQKISSAIHHPNSTITIEAKIRYHIRLFAALTFLDPIA